MPKKADKRKKTIGFERREVKEKPATGDVVQQLSGSSISYSNWNSWSGGSRRPVDGS